MIFFKTPSWISEHRFTYEKYEEIPDAVFIDINHNLDSVQSENPEVSIVVIAWNEEVNIISCISSLSKMLTEIPFEIIVVNNNSSDKTQQSIDRLHIRSFNEPTQGAGPARERGQVNAKGKYVLTADADCFYPNCWVDEMLKVLKQPEVVCVYGRYSFISEPGYPRWKLSVLEKLKDFIAEIRHLRQPYFNTFGISMGYVKIYGLKIGFIKINRRGEDGQLCMDMMKYGKIKQMRSNNARVWTGVRTLQQNGSIFNAIYIRIREDFRRFKYNFISRT